MNGDNDPVSHYVLLMQTLEWAHQQRYREGAALANLDKIHWTIHQAELTNVAQTQRLDTIMGRGGIADCGNAQACVEVCPKDIPLTDAFGELGRQTTKLWLQRLFGQ